MNILFLALDINLARNTGDSIHAQELATFLAARGHSVDLVTAAAGSRQLPGVHLYERPAHGDWRIVRFCSRIARARHSEIVYERRLSPKIAYALGLMTQRPFVIEINGIEEEGAMQGRPSKMVRWRFRLRRKMYQKAAHVVTVTESLAALVRERYGLPANHITVIPNGVDLERFQPSDTDQARYRLGWSPGPWVVFVGNMAPWQGLETLIQSVPTLLSHVASARLALVGDGMQRRFLERFAVELGVRERVLFVGSVPNEEVPTYLAASSVCVAPFTRARNQKIGLSPLKLFEYMACARPIVASNLPGVAEILEASGAGLSVPPDDPVRLGLALAEVLRETERGREMGQRGLAYVSTHGSWALAASRVERVLAGVLARQAMGSFAPLNIPQRSRGPR